MCNPFMIAGLALTAGGSIATGVAENNAAKARASALEAERTRQRGFESRQAALADQSQQSMQDFTGDQAQRTADLTAYYQEPVASDANAESGMIAPEGTSSITTRELARQSGAATDRANDNAANLAGLRSFGSLMGDRMRGMQRNSSQIDQLTGFRRGSTDALTPELDAAAQSGAGLRLLGDVLRGAGSITSGYGSLAGAGNPVVTNALGRLGGQTASLPAGTVLRPMARPNLLG